MFKEISDPYEDTSIKAKEVTDLIVALCIEPAKGISDFGIEMIK